MRIVPINDRREPYLAPDIVWDFASQMGDFALADPDEKQNHNGLRAKAAIATAATICLMTDARVDPSELRDGDTNRGWHGDSYDLDGDAGETPIGSKLWLLRRRSLGEPDLPRIAEDYARESLQTLIDQGAVAAVTAAATRNGLNRLDLDIQLTDKAGVVVFDRRFAILWDQINDL